MEQRRCWGCMNPVTEEICPHCGYSIYQNNGPNQLPVGTMLRDQYLVGKVLGQGGFGITYIGWDTYLDMVVAIKEFYPIAAVNRDVTQSRSVQLHTQEMSRLYENSRERFLREAKTLAKLRKIPEIVGIQSFFRENNTAYIIMEYVQGIDLRHYVQRKGGRLSPQETLQLLQPIVHALDTVHQAGLVHRDISPDNIMLQAEGGAKLLDFGAARDAGDDDADIDLSHSTEAILKHGFAPVEQYRSRGNLGPWTDEYGFCATVYYCLTGKVPPDALARLTEDIQPDWDMVYNLTSRQRAALEKGMAMRAKDRFGSMQALHDELYAWEEPMGAIYIGQYIGEEPAPESVRKAPKPAPDVCTPVREVPKPAPEVPTPAPEPVREVPKPAPDVPLPRKKKSWLPAAAGILAVAAVIGGIAMLGGKDKNTEVSLESQPEVIVEAHTEVLLVEETSESVISVEPWEANVLKMNPLAYLNIAKDEIETVTFLDTLADAPDNAVDVSSDGTGSVKAWVSNKNVTIAAEGGINGRLSSVLLFKDCSNLTTVTFGEAFHTNLVASMEGMFHNCHQLKQVDVQMLDAGNVKDMSSMFYACWKLQTVDVSDWDVSSVVDMGHSFVNCHNLQTLDVSGWDVSGVTDMGYMFHGCDNLQTLDVSGWDVSGVTNMSYMFNWCNGLQTLDVSRWDVSNVTDMSYMFSNTSWQLQPDISSWDVSNVTIFSGFFSDGRTINGKPWRSFFQK